MMKYRVILAINAVLIIPIGYLVRFSPILPEWFRNFLGNVAYETLLILLLLLVVPKMKPIAAAVVVCLFSFAIEFLQLSQDPILVAARSTLLGRLILGNGFTWEDFPLYVVGSFAGWLWVTQLRRWARGIGSSQTSG
jgi:glycopeptide antibiotics resistance protein